MPCISCGNEDTLSVDGDRDRSELCPACLDKRWPDLRLGSLLSAFQRPLLRTGVCPHCGCTEAQAVQTGLVGCPVCYEALSDKVWREFGLI